MASKDNWRGYFEIQMRRQYQWPEDELPAENGGGLMRMNYRLKNGGGLVRMKIPATNVEEATNDPRIECLPISMSDALLAENTILETRQKIQTKVQMPHYWPKKWSLKNIDFWCTFKVFISYFLSSKLN